MKKIVISIAVVVAVVLIIGFAPLMDVPYQEIETYYVDEPYEAMETYIDTMPLSYKIVKSYTDLESYEVWRMVAGKVKIFFPIGCVVVKNTDSGIGTVNIQFTFYQLTESMAQFLVEALGESKDEVVKTGGSKKYDSGNLTLEPGETGTIRYSFENAIEDKLVFDYYLWDWEYTVTQATKPVEMERTITKYRQVEQERTVTRYKKGSIFQYLLSRF